MFQENHPEIVPSCLRDVASVLQKNSGALLLQGHTPVKNLGSSCNFEQLLFGKFSVSQFFSPIPFLHFWMFFFSFKHFSDAGLFFNYKNTERKCTSPCCTMLSVILVPSLSQEHAASSCFSRWHTGNRVRRFISCSHTPHSHQIHVLFWLTIVQMHTRGGLSLTLSVSLLMISSHLRHKVGYVGWVLWPPFMFKTTDVFGKICQYLPIAAREADSNGPISDLSMGFIYFQNKDFCLHQKVMLLFIHALHCKEQLMLSCCDVHLSGCLSVHWPI